MKASTKIVSYSVVGTLFTVLEEGFNDSAGRETFVEGGMGDKLIESTPAHNNSSSVDFSVLIATSSLIITV